MVEAHACAASVANQAKMNGLCFSPKTSLKPSDNIAHVADFSSLSRVNRSSLLG